MTTLGIGLPVYNDEKAIGNILDCVLSQTFQDFELHIYDNCSTDNTINILKEYQKKDKRIFIHLNSINVGLAENFNKCLHLKNFKDFKYVSIKSANDRIDPTYYEKCIDFLENNQDFCCCYSEGTNTINADIKLYSYEQDDVYERIESIIATQGWGNINYSIIRSSIIDKILPFMPIQGNDHIFFLNMVMLGKLKKLEEILYDRASIAGRTEEAYRRLACGSISGRILEIPHFMQLIMGYIDFCNTCFLNNLERDKIIDMVIDISIRERYNIISYQYDILKKMVKKQKNLNINDYIFLREMFYKLRYYLLKNPKFKSKHKKDYINNFFYQL